MLWTWQKKKKEGEEEEKRNYHPVFLVQQIFVECVLYTSQLATLKKPKTVTVNEMFVFPASAQISVLEP